MTREERENALHCLKVMIDEEVCEECKLYGSTGTDHCEADCVRVAINALEQEPSEEYKRGWYDAIVTALKETYSCYTDDGVFRVIQEESLIGVGMTMQEPKIVEQYQNEIDHLHKYITKLETQIVEQVPQTDIRDNQVKDELNRVKDELEPCEDCISREQAKAEIRKAFPSLADRVDINSILNGLPGVKLTTKESLVVAENTTSDCISRQAVINAIYANNVRENEYNLTSSRIKKAVEELPSVTPQEPIILKANDKQLQELKELIHDNPLCAATVEPKTDNIKALGEELRTVRGGIKDENVLIGYNMAVAICNKHLSDCEVRNDRNSKS